MSHPIPQSQPLFGIPIDGISECKKKILLSEQIICPGTNVVPYNTEHIFRCSFQLVVLESTTSSLKDTLLLLTFAIHPFFDLCTELSSVVHRLSITVLSEEQG